MAISLVLITVLFYGLHIFLLCDFFFFKQKTAYEMRISDWSSDVCSSDLVAGGLLVETDGLLEFLPVLCVDGHGLPLGFGRERGLLRPWEKDGPRRAINRARTGRIQTRRRLDGRTPLCGIDVTSRIDVIWKPTARSEEHTSELQSLMRISYDVLCLKQKN